MSTYPDRSELDAPFEALPTAMHRPGGIGSARGASALGDYVPAWQQPDEDNKRTAFFSREEVLRKSRVVEPAPLREAPRPLELSRPPARAARPEPEEELPTVIVDSLPSPPAATAVVRKRRPSRLRRYGAAIVGVMCGALGIGVGISAAFAIERGPSAVASSDSAVRSSDSAAAAPVAAAAVAPQAPVAPTAEVVEAPAEPAPAEPAAAEAAAETAPAAAEPAPETLSPEAMLAEARAALDAVDVDVAQAAIDRARTAQANPAMLRRFEAELAVLRGDGALSVPRLQGLAELHDDPALHVAHGRLLVQAERDDQATRAFRRALASDPSQVDAHLGLAGIRARAFAMPAARRHLRDAEEALQLQPAPSARLRARLLVAESMVALESGSRSRAQELAQSALDIDAQSAEAHFLLARMTDGREATRHLRLAVGGRAPAPVSTGMLASQVRGDEACELAARYLDRAPRGYDAPALRRINRRCGG